MAFAFTAQEPDIILETPCRSEEVCRKPGVRNTTVEQPAQAADISHRDDIGEEYPKVLKLMVTGACKETVSCLDVL